MPEPVIFWGATGQAKVLRDCISGQGYKLSALFDNNTRLSSPFADVPLFYGREGFRSWQQHYMGAPVSFLAAIGGNKGKERLLIQEFLQAEGLQPLTAIHGTAWLSSGVTIGEGSQVLAGAILSVDVQIGRACIINTGAVVDHECRLDDGVHICPGARLAGDIKIAQYAMIGTGAVILPHINIAEGAVIGAGAVVTGDVPAYTVVAGNPARLVRRLK
ncbi:MAG: acetyltransferase [Syntrophomonas sp.]